MSDADMFDAATGELPPAANGGPPTSARAQSVGVVERQIRRAEAMGLGNTGLYEKLAEAYKTIAPVLAKEAEGQSGRGKYTSLDAVLRAVRKPLLEAGVLIRQGADRVFPMGEGTQKSFWTVIYTDLIDTISGQVQRTELPMPITQANPQAVGAVMTYGRRYTLLAALGIASGEPGDDDDAQSAMPREMKVETEVEELIRECKENETEADANKWKSAMHKRLQDLAPDDFEAVKAAFTEHVKALRAAPAKAKK
jgi:hypothetical protein